MIPLFALLTATVTPLDALNLGRWHQSFSRPMPRQSIRQEPLVVNGKRYEHGVGSHAPSVARYELGGRGTRIVGSVGVADSGSGTVGFSVWVDGHRRWSSTVLRRGQAAQAFNIDLTGAREITLVTDDGLNGSGGDHACWLDVQISHNGAVPAPLSAMRPLRPLLNRSRQTIDNFAASDSWTVEPLIRWPEARRKEIARLLFDRQTGIGLSGWRHNLGGGIDHESISVPLRTADTYDAGEGKFDFSRNPGQRWMLEAANRYGVEHLIAYAITPTRRMTRNGFTTGTDANGSTNLRSGEEGAYARYLAGVLEHFINKGYPFTHLSPINEPDYEWNAGTQEGNRASNPDLLRITLAIAEELRRRKLSVRILTPEASAPQKGYELNAGMEKKYGAPYGAYASLFHDQPAWRRTVDPVFGYHSYWADGLENMHAVRARLRKELDRTPELKPWMTEYCQLSGPRGEGGWGRDLGMTLALNLARLVHLDLTVVEASAWQWWLGVSDADFKDGLVYVDDLDKPDGEVIPSKALWAFGNFARFVRPGFKRIELEGPFADVAGILPTGFIDPKTGRVVLVLVNTETSHDVVEIDLPGSWTTQAYITSDRPGHNLARYAAPKARGPFRIPSRSVVTMIFDPKR